MASTINASSSGSGGLISTGDASGVLQLQNNGSVAVTVSGGSVGLNGITSPSQIIDIGAAGKIYLRRADNGTGTYLSDGGAGVGTIINEANGDGLSFQSNGTTQFRVNSTGNVILYGGTAAASGVGITFPSSQSASTNANCLDDYEEGTFTPVVKNGSTTLTYGTDWDIRLGGSIVNYYPYVKVGNIVSLGFTLNFNSSQTGRFNFSLPFNFGYGDYTCAGSLSWYTVSSSVSGTVGYLGLSTGSIDFFLVTDTGTHQNLAVTGSTEIYINLCYISA